MQRIRVRQLIISIVVYLVSAEFLYSWLRPITSQNTSSDIVVLLEYLACAMALFSLTDAMILNLDDISKNRRKLWLIPLFVILDFGLQIILQNIFTVQSANQGHVENVLHGNSNLLGLIFMFIMVVIVGPIMEEIIFQYLFQKVIFKGLLERLKFNKLVISILSILLATILFMLYHVTSISDFTTLAIFTYSDLVLFAIIYEITDDNLIYPIVVHSLGNLIGFVLVLI
ncbi:CPBP family intramembrane glutamic endopeptidase [Companilactobacillus baiquanensis]|uniref:CPBP family intramembrane glutamic endopeptidase n=1 Tax=Companilactobacillus baiquanensis TaxID=2486005 RepID=A0ABW1USQ6_9LACO|nr:CPBP family intramembrane glutamic endopeptidase [Companilactobacillus baiquanensis]